MSMQSVIHTFIFLLLPHIPRGLFLKVLFIICLFISLPVSSNAGDLIQSLCIVSNYSTTETHIWSQRWVSSATIGVLLKH